MRKNAKSFPKYNYQAISHFIDLMENLKLKRKCFTFQVLKQFILFPSDQSSSSSGMISKYDKLLFDDEALHTMFKKI